MFEAGNADISSRAGRRRRASRRALFAVIVALCAVVAGIALEAWRRQALYWYDVRQDYSYDFGAGATSTSPVDVAADGFELPAWQGRRDSALLKLRISSGLLGWWFDPCIVITTDNGPDRQCFERGGKGDRYVLLPPTVIEPGRRIHMRGEHLHWDPQAAELLLFDSPDISNSRVLVLAPHPDDAEIAAFGLYSSHDSFIVAITAGNYVDGLYSGLHRDVAAQDRLRGEVRTWDSLAVPLWGGVTLDRVASLGYPTYSLRAYYEAAQDRAAVQPELLELPEVYRQGALESLLGGRTASPDWESLVADLASVIESIRPDVIVTPHPAMDDHTDHQFTTIALLEALERVHDETTVLLLYNNHHILAEHYPFGPSDTRVTLPPWFGEARFAGLLSLELDEGQQMRKLFALEAMHDLRPAPLRLTGGPATVLKDRIRQAYEVVRRDPFGDYSYFRRAVRPNEIFLSYGAGERHLLLRSRDRVTIPVPQD